MSLPMPPTTTLRILQNRIAEAASKVILAMCSYCDAQATAFGTHSSNPEACPPGSRQPHGTCLSHMPFVFILLPVESVFRAPSCLSLDAPNDGLRMERRRCTFLLG